MRGRINFVQLILSVVIIFFLLLKCGDARSGDVSNCGLEQGERLLRHCAPRNDVCSISSIKRLAFYAGDSTMGVEQNAGCSFVRKAAPYAIAVSAGSILFAFDDEINEFAQRPRFHSHTADLWSKTIAYLGTGGPYVVTAPLLLGHGLVFKNKKTVFASVELAVGVLAAESITKVVKSGFGRLRPYQTDSPFKFFKGGSAFYSGHVVTIFTYSTIMAKNFPRQNLGFIGIHHDVPIVPIVCYTAGAMVGIQRLYSKNHWTTDVYFGALAGYAIGSLTVHFGEKIRLERFAVASGNTPMIIVWFEL